MRGADHYAWKGDDARTTTKRERAQAMYELGTCERCQQAQATDRHHVDGDTGHNDRANIQLLCRRCHMLEDGRLEALTRTARENSERARRPARVCVNCAQFAKDTRRGRCHACAEYFARNGRDRSLAPLTHCPEGHELGLIPRKRADQSGRWDCVICRRKYFAAKEAERRARLKQQGASS